MSNPNAFAAAVAAGVTIGVQWLVQRYAHIQLNGYWKSVVTGTVSAAVLYVGRDGVKNALARLWNGPAKLWSGSQPPPAAKSSST